jgi:DNA integrity scanning protein DisA with diadenylate cyclase activity
MGRLRGLAIAGLMALLIGTLPQQGSAQNDFLPSEVLALFRDIDDVDKLRVLNPLKLTAEQLEKIIAEVKRHQQTYHRRLADSVVPPIRSIAREIKETRRKLLTGGEIPKDFDEKVKKLQADYVKRRDQEDRDTLKSLSDTIRAILSEEQVKKAVELAKTLTQKDGKPTLRGSDAEFFNYYVMMTFVVYPRIVPLMEDMKRALQEESASGSSATP